MNQRRVISHGGKVLSREGKVLFEQVLAQTPPLVFFESPASGAVLSGIVQVRIQASDEVRMRSLAVFIGPLQLGTVTAPIHTTTLELAFSVDAQELPAGARELVGKAVNSAGLITHVRLPVYIAHALSPQP
jgi:hypothetical protein